MTPRTLTRSVDGGRFLAYEGLLLDPPGEVDRGRELAEQHSEKTADNLSAFLLEKCGLYGRRVRRNKAGDTNSLSFRNLARLLIVTETEIIEQRSPLSDGNPISDTPSFATFKLLLTGVDDSALIARAPRSPADYSREAQAELLDQLLDDYRDKLKELTRHPDQLDDQLSRIESSLSQQSEQLATTESEFREIARRRRQLRQRLEEGQDRRSEIESLLQRFALLQWHYKSDIDRLRAIEEAGTLFTVLGQAPCPLCGAQSEHHDREGDCDGNVDAVVTAARAEIAKIELLQAELEDTRKGLADEAASFDRRLPKVREELETISDRVNRLISPKLTRLRAEYGELADKRGEVREALALYSTMRDIQRRREELDEPDETETSSTVADGDLPIAVSEAFARHVETILREWHFPDADRVYFDAKSRDLVIAGKLRHARGKGLRAITHAAFTVGLLEYCRMSNTPHPGFVVLDSPLLAYRAPEGDEDDLTGTDLDDQFYRYLSKMPDDRQVIIFENTNPPSDVINEQQTVMFSKNPHYGRYGFFPLRSTSHKA